MVFRLFLSAQDGWRRLDGVPRPGLIITHIYPVWTQDSGFCRVWQSSPKVNREFICQPTA